MQFSLTFSGYINRIIPCYLHEWVTYNFDIQNIYWRHYLFLCKLFSLIIDSFQVFIYSNNHTYYKQIQGMQQSERPMYYATGFIPGNQNYFNFNLSSEHQLQVPQGLYIVPFQTHNVTFKQLLQSLLEQLSLKKKYSVDMIQLSLKSGYAIKKKMTAQDILIKLGRQSASGLTIKAKINREIVNQAAYTPVMYHIATQLDFNHGHINKLFLLLNNKEPFYISIQKYIDIGQLQRHICDALNLQYKNVIAPKHLSFYRIRKTDTECLEFSWEEVNELIGNEVTQNIINDEQQIIGVKVVKENTQWPCSEVASEDYLIFHAKNDYQIKLRFSMIAKYQVGELLKYLKIQHSNNLGIKIVDEIFPPYKLVKQASKYFQTEPGKFVKKIECRLVSEKEIFYDSVNKIQQDFEIDKDMVTKAKEQQFDKCKDLARRRSQQSRQKNQKHFTNYNQIIPITLYTSSVEVIDPNSTQTKPLYRSLKGHFHNNRFGLSDADKNQWQYKFSSTLIKSLKKIPPYDVKNQNGKVIVYRGIRGHQLQGQVGQLYIAKQFVSTSAIKQKAQNFTKDKDSKTGTFLQIQSLTGRSIKQFSVYEKEEEIVFMPYTYFRIEKKDTSGPYLKMKLVQLPPPQQQFQSNPTTIFLWIDDKSNEAELVINNLNFPMQTTIFYQLPSTRALHQWIDSNPSWIGNHTLKKVVITNMKRRENSIDVFNAGAQTYKLATQKIKDCKIAFYVKNIEGTKQELIKSGINPTGIKIYNKRAHLRDFIHNLCAPIKQAEKQAVVQQSIRSFIKSFSEIRQANLFD